MKSILLCALCFFALTGGATAANSAPEIMSPAMSTVYGILGSEVGLYADTWDRDGDKLTHTRTFGDGSNATTTEQAIAHNYPAEGIYDVTVVSSDGMASVTRSFQVEIRKAENAIPLARLTASKHLVLVNEPVEFDATASVAFSSVPLSQITWSFGDGT